MIARLFGSLRARTLKQRIRYWSGTLIAALGIVIVVSFYGIEKTGRQNEVHGQLQQIVTLQSGYIDEWIRERLNDMRTLTSLQSAKNLNNPAMLRAMLATKKQAAEYYSIVFVGQDGFTALNTTAQIGMDARDREYFLAAKEGKEYVSNVMVSRSNEQPIITVSSPLYGDDGSFLGAMVGSISLKVLDSMMKKMSFGETGDMYVVDKNGMLVTNAKDEAMTDTFRPRIRTAIVDRARKGEDSMDAYFDYKGDMVFGSYRWTNDDCWLIIGEVRKTEVFHDLYNVMWTISGITMLFIVISFAIVFILTNRIERPLRFLLTGTKIIQDGHFDYQIDRAYFQQAPQELQQLCERFNLMSRKLKATVEMLEHSSLIDQLSEVYNRRYLMNEGSKLLDASAAAGRPCSAIMADIDYFKRINDTYGHLAGDRIIRHFARLLTQHAGMDTIVSRYGGEEFVVLVLGSGIQASASLAERVREALEAEPYSEGELTVAYTASFGVAAANTASHEYGTTQLEDLVARADEALYFAKRQGRNRVALEDAAMRKREPDGGAAPIQLI